MNELADDDVIARLRSALNEVTKDSHGLVSADAPRLAGSSPARWLAMAAAVVLVIGGVTAVVINRNQHGSTPTADSTPITPTEPTLIRTVVPWYVLASQDLAPGGIFGIENQLPADELTIAWALGGNPADGLLVLRSGPSSPALGPADTSLATYRMIGDQALAVASYGLTPQEQADLAAQIQSGSGLPWVLPVEGWAFLGMGVHTDGATRFTRYSNGTEAVDISVGPLIDQFFTLATADTLQPVTVAGRAGWKATNADRVYVMWPAADSGRWATMTIVPALADRVDGLIAAVAEVLQDGEPTADTVPAPPASDAADGIGRLQIPSIGLDLTVVDPGSNFEDAMKLGPVLLDGPSPGAVGGVAVVWGERTTYGAPFARLDELQPGDTITWSDHEGTVTFEVIAVQSSDDPDSAVVPEGTTLQLRTLTPEFTSQQVLVVYARRSS